MEFLLNFLLNYITLSCYGFMGVGPPAGWIDPDVMVTMRINPK